MFGSITSPGDVCRLQYTSCHRGIPTALSFLERPPRLQEMVDARNREGINSVSQVVSQGLSIFTTLTASCTVTLINESLAKDSRVDENLDKRQ